MVGKPTETWESPDGSQVLVLPYGGRVLGLFPDDGGENFLWTHAALAESSTAKAFYESDVWHNSGGDRTWLAPEIDFFFPEYPRLDRYWQQRELDPGQYEPSRVQGSLGWSTRARLTLSRTRQSVDLELSKRLSPALNPLRYGMLKVWDGLTFSGYTLTTTLHVAGDRPPKIGIWQLLQMPHGGDMMVPTFSHVQPTVCMGTISEQDLEVEPQLVRYRMRATGEQKLCLHAPGLTGRAGYLWSKGEQASLVVRNFNVNPSGEYADVPWHQPDSPGFAFEACNVNSGLGAFSELEHHAPAIDAATGKSFSEDQSQVWAFRGPEPAVRSVAKHLLGPNA